MFSSESGMNETSSRYPAKSSSPCSEEQFSGGICTVLIRLDRAGMFESSEISCGKKNRKMSFTKSSNKVMDDTYNIIPASQILAKP